jgi:threonine dehydratase
MSAPWHLQPPDFAEIEAAHARIAPHLVVTPLLESPAVNARCAARILIKPECQQRTGSFKIRGALNRLLQLDAAERSRGVVAFSSGNHALAVATAARQLGLPAVIVMPSDAPRTKIEGTRALGAEVIEYDRNCEDRAAIAARLQLERGLALAPPYDDRRIVAGQGTLGRELALQLRELGLHADILVLGCSGGGLSGGCAIAFAALSPDTAVWAVEPAGFDDTARSLAAGERVSNAAASGSICDALMVSTPGALTFEINRRLLAGAVAVTDAEAVAAMRLVQQELQIRVEPGGVVGLAAVLQGRIAVAGKTVAVILTGGNIDDDTYRALLTGGAPRPERPAP